jgi:hypothetical protein
MIVSRLRDISEVEVGNKTAGRLARHVVQGVSTVLMILLTAACMSIGEKLIEPDVQLAANITSSLNIRVVIIDAHILWNVIR